MYPKKRKPKKDRPPAIDYEFLKDLDNEPIDRSLERNLEVIREMFRDCSDVVIRSFDIEKGIPAAAIFVDGLAKTDDVEQAMKCLMILEGGEVDVQRIVDRTLPVTQTSMTKEYGPFLLGILGGDTGVLVEGNDQAILMGIRGPNTRSVSEPETESVIRGPREGFIENLRTNTSLIRRKIKSPRLKMKPMVVGLHSNTNVVLCYMEGITNPALIQEAEERISRIHIDSILESGYLEEFIQDSAYSPFPQIQYTERPEVVAQAVMTGRLAIMIDGTPFVLLVPTVFINFMQASEDFNERFQIGTLLRWLRYLLLFASLLTPAVYVAVTTFHQEMIPTSLLLSIAGAREQIPFPAVIETLLMEVVFEALREAGIRLPKAVGSAVGILGALVIGSAAVEAGIVSAPIVIVVSMTGIASFAIPHFNGAIAVRMLRFPLILIGSMFGLYGILAGLMIIIGHMAGLRSFGVPFLAPMTPMKWKDAKHVFFRPPLWDIQTRPSYTYTQDAVKMGNRLPREIMEQNGQKGKRIEHPENSDPNGGQEEGGS
ncbi:putative membrane protein YfkQ [Paenibacillus sp. J31TS4]|uniref:spore germination protein n=1 Tax=Paenibacillus sp. J31TS4 TaxID=2807195 RepID=UPI001B29C21E|nr:spore germination protein [Paenibacillus sp. J31TS4]GIP39995.1 putative membrane protein YfkQ [Paenibacillus sp. J31TS4]